MNKIIRLILVFGAVMAVSHAYSQQICNTDCSNGPAGGSCTTYCFEVGNNNNNDNHVPYWQRP